MMSDPCCEFPSFRPVYLNGEQDLGNGKSVTLVTCFVCRKTVEYNPNLHAVIMTAEEARYAPELER